MKREELDEYLETLWHLFENDESDVESFRQHIKGAFDEQILNTLKVGGYITIDGNKIKLTDKGYSRAEQIIRRHRLAERLLGWNQEILRQVHVNLNISLRQS